MGDEQTTEQPVEQTETPEQPSHYIAKSTTEHTTKPTKIERLREFITACKRVINITKKPDRDEFKTIVKISGAGILIIGLIGFLVAVAKDLLF